MKPATLLKAFSKWISFQYERLVRKAACKLVYFHTHTVYSIGKIEIENRNCFRMKLFPGAPECFGVRGNETYKVLTELIFFPFDLEGSSRIFLLM